MSRVRLERTVAFRASHHYRRPDWTDERNRRVFADALEPHAHDWRLTVWMEGPPDDQGMLADLGEVDAVLRDVVLGPFEGGDLNAAVPPVRDGRMQPSTEGLARWLFHRIEERLPRGLRLVRLRLAESDTLAAEVEP